MELKTDTIRYTISDSVPIQTCKYSNDNTSYTARCGLADFIKKELFSKVIGCLY